MNAKSLLFIVIPLLIKTVGISQKIDSVNNISKNKISFVTIFDKNKATKDGYYINGYVVNIDYDKGQQLHMKKIRITGKVTVVKGLKNTNSKEPIKQGRYEDTKHILKPTVEVLD